MKKITIISLLSLGALLLPPAASATVTVTSGPTSLVTEPLLVKASSGQVGLFSVTLSQDAGESLSSITVLITNNASSTATSSDLASVSVYKDNGNGAFDASSDALAGTQASVNIGSTTTVATAANNAIDGSKFFVSLATAASWSDAAPADSIKVSFPTDGIVTSANSPTVTSAMTNSITADTHGPTLTSAVGKNTGGTSAKEAGDSVELNFSESTTKPTVNTSTIESTLMLSSSHSFKDGSGALGGSGWNVEGTKLTVTLSASSSLPTVEPGDSVTIIGSSITDLAGNIATGTKVITGNFSGDVDGEGDLTTHCGNGLKNGRLYKIADNPTVYLAAACRLKPFRGAAVFHARGHKFLNIIILASSEGITISDKPVLPASGTLVQGANATVWFVTADNHRRGFRTAAKFFALGFRFGQVSRISDADLALIPVGLPIEQNESHPSGALIKCGGSLLVFQIVGNTRFPFRSSDAFLSRGHSWEHIAVVDCGIFSYVRGAPVD